MRVLIADDDPSELLMLKRIVEEWDYHVVTASDGSEAWEILRRADSPSLAILDWMMPGLDGVDVCRRVRREGESPFVYLILLTGRASTEDLVEGMDSGANDFVNKPFKAEVLKARLQAGRRMVDLQAALWTEASRDTLTGTWNRRKILETLRHEAEYADREGKSLGVVMVDIDHFKQLNDTLGHPAGDAALCESAKRMDGALRPYDSIGRYGGEEFLVVLPDCDLAGALAVAERVRLAIARAPVETPSKTISITVSLGVATGSGPSLDVESLIRKADEALYRAKRGGRNRVEV
jgi:diguanylate cyclase (GGDEF)-like protein